jgi:hypothetical protein
MSYDEKTDQEILDDINSGNVPGNALADWLTWRRLCQVHQRYSLDIDKSIWHELCSQRGRLRNGSPALPPESEAY